VTFLLTDVESSTKLWEDHPFEMKGALERHDSILRETIEAHGGYVFKTVGDAFCAAFEEPVPAVGAAVAVQGLLGVEAWPAGVNIKVRMAIHSGACHERGGDFFGPPVNRAARLLVLGHGGQILVSGATAGLLADDLPEHLAMRDLGRHRLKDLERPERVFQLCAQELQVAFGPLACVEGASVEHNLPRSAALCDALRGKGGRSRRGPPANRPIRLVSRNPHRVGWGR
jgi:class 3 adenylate cyclase